MPLTTPPDPPNPPWPNAPPWAYQPPADCPFCSAAQTHRDYAVWWETDPKTHKPITPKLYQHRCPHCGASGPNGADETEMTELWNRRAAAETNPTPTQGKQTP